MTGRETGLATLTAATIWLSFLTWQGLVANAGEVLLVPLLLPAALVAVSGAVLRSQRWSWWAVFLAQVAALSLWATQRWAPAEGALGVLPTPAAVSAIARQVAAAVEASRVYPAPVPTEATTFPVLCLLVAVGCLVLADLLAGGLRRPVLIGLPAAVVMVVPSAILLTRTSWWLLVLPWLAFALVLGQHESERIRRWGRHEGVAVGARLVPSAAALGLGSAALAIVAATMVPTIGSNLLVSGSGGGGGSSGPVTLTNPLVDLRRDLIRGQDVSLIVVRTDDPSPSYLRTAVLDVFRRNEWQPARRETAADNVADGALPSPVGLDPAVPVRRYRYSFDANSVFVSTWLPTPFPAIEVDAPGDWRYDEDTMDFFSGEVTTSGLRWTAVGVQPQLTPELLNEAGPVSSAFQERWTDLPTLPASVTRLAERVTAGAETDYQRAVALQDFFRRTGGFRYSLATEAGNGTDDLVRFLDPVDGREGYCEQFAAAMAAMGRAVGVPSRVAVGFLKPSRSVSDGWVYSSYDLHAWPEMFFRGVGWVRFEPTPSARSGAAPAYTSGVQEPEPAASPAAPSATAAPAPLTPTPAGDEAGAPAVDTQTGPPRVLRWLPLAVLAAVVLGLLPAAGRVVRRRRRALATGPAVYPAAWAEVRDTARDLAIAWDDATTLRRTADRLLTQIEGRATPRARHQDARAAGDRLVAGLERWRFGPDPAVTADRDQVWADADTIVSALRASAEPAARRRARWWPTSWREDLRTSLVTGVGRAAGAAGKAARQPLAPAGAVSRRLRSRRIRAGGASAPPTAP